MDSAKDKPLFEAPGGDWSQCPPDLRALEANRATTLALFDSDAKLLRKLFQDHGRDPDNPWHWRGLVMTFAAVLYPKSGRPGLSLHEHRQFIADYLDAVVAVRKRGKRRPTRIDIADQMKTKHPKRYRQDVDTLAKSISKRGIKPAP